MTEERNREQLKRAIAHLPVYQAPGQVWEAIHEQLNADHQEDLIRKTITALPVYQAPESSWTVITQQLDEPIPINRRSSLIRWMGAAAAGLAVLLVAGTLWWPSPEAVNISYLQETEAVPTSILQQDWDADEGEIAEVVALYKKHRQVFEPSDEPQLLEDWQELNLARRELKEAIELYGSDSELIRQLGMIERERADLLKKMAARI